jgi:hypothetical protein
MEARRARWCIERAAEKSGALVIWMALTLAGLSIPRALVAAPRLSGSVLDELGQPVVSADLDFFQVGTKTRVDPTPPGAPAQSERTNLLGQYSLLVKPDTYDIRYQPPSGRTDLATVLISNVAIQGDTILTVTLPHGVPLSGVVRTRSGNPVPDVDLDLTDDATGRRVPTPGDNTGASGAYQVVIQPGTYTVSFTPPQGARLAAAQIRGVVVRGATRLEVTLEAGLEISGLVQDASGAPLGGVDIDVDDAATGERIHTVEDVTTPDGWFAVIVPEGRFDLTFVPPAGLALAAGIVRGVAVSADASLSAVTLAAGVQVRAEVRGPDGQPFPGAKALFFESQSSLRYPAPGAVAGGDGRFTIRLPPALYYVRILPPPSVALDPLEAGERLFESDTDVVWSFGGAVLHTLSVHLFVSTPDEPADGALLIWRSPRSGSPVASTVARDGLAEVDLPQGRYDVLIRIEPGLEPDSVFVESLELNGNQTLEFSFARDAVATRQPFLGPASPNPFREATRFRFLIPDGVPVRLAVYDVMGRLVRSGPLSSGGSDFEWNGSDASGRPAPAGHYIVRLESRNGVSSQRVVKVR